MTSPHLTVPKNLEHLRSPVCKEQDPKGTLQCSHVPGEACANCPGLCKRLALGEVPGEDPAKEQTLPLVQ